MTLEAGWLQRQMDCVREDIEKWPEWMKREAGLLPALPVRIPESVSETTASEQRETVQAF